MAAVLAVALVWLTAACGTSSPASPEPSASVTVKSATVRGVGRVLTNDAGKVLYMFPPDKRAHVTCTGRCAGSWPPLAVRAGEHAKAGNGVQAALLGVMTSPDGTHVTTYNHWPLYTYAGDVDPGDTTGQALDLDGGYWYVIRPSGAPVVPAGKPPVPESVRP